MMEDKDKNPFKMPEGYLDTFDAKMMERIEEEEMPNKTKFVNVFKTFMYLVATFVIVFGLGRVIVPLVVDPSEKIQAQSTIQRASVETVNENEALYDEMDDLDITDDEIIEYLSEEKLENNYLMAELK